MLYSMPPELCQEIANAVNNLISGHDETLLGGKERSDAQAEIETIELRSFEKKGQLI